LTTKTDTLIETLKANWTLEMDGVEMYQALAERQTIPERRTIFQHLSGIEKKHADAWARKLTELGAPIPAGRHGHGHAHSHAAGPASSPHNMHEILLAIEESERRDVAAYLQQMHEIHDESVRAILREVVLDEFSHAHVLSRLYAQSSDRSTLDVLRRRQRQGTGSWIGDAVYGVNDGLGAIFGIVSGVSGATLDKPNSSQIVLLAGIAGMVASALSMGAGAFLASKSEREIYEAEVFRERQSLEEHPETAKEELAIFYQLKGVPEEDAKKIVEFLASNPEQFLRTMTAEKLNLTEEALSNPVISALSGSVSTAVGAFIPIIPFFFLNGIPAVVAAGIVSLLAHFLVGAAKSLVTVRSWWASGLEMTLVGALEGAVTYLVGIGLGQIGA